ncbi:MAG: hypothetical protein ABF968_04970 [Acetobacter sp.]|uniref:hypothetical protein n=1 Tax=Acetobacter sp. TaxID=440 RepID=UPI0039ECBE00
MTITYTREYLIERLANDLISADQNAPNPIERAYLAAAYAEAVAIIDGKTPPLTVVVDR